MKPKMKYRTRLVLLMISTVLIITSCGNVPSSQMGVSPDPTILVGAWRSKIVFRSGSLSEIKDLEFLYAFNVGGTMTESSNYDQASNSSPPAYGVWKQIAPRTFETKYLFYTTKAPSIGDGAPNNTDWWPSGYGVLTETVTLSEDGQTYTSTIKLDLFDKAGTPIAGGGKGTGAGRRIVF